MIADLYTRDESDERYRDNILEVNDEISILILQNSLNKIVKN